jgi:hypothetical protein
MATRASFNITVTSSRGASHTKATSKGRYVSFTTAGITLDMPQQPIIGTPSLKQFWLDVLNPIVAELEAMP